jgi:hypothetical protein
MRFFNFYKILLLISFIYINESHGNSLVYYQNILEQSGKEYMAGNYAKSLEYLIEVKTFAEVNNHIELQMHALNNMGIVYTGILDYEKAIECYLEAYQIAIKEQDKRLEMTILSNISELYSINNEPDKAKEYVEKAFEGAIQIKDSLRAGRYAINFASFANQTGDLIQAEKYIDIAMSMLEGQTGDPSLLIITKLAKVENLYLKKEYNKAEQLAVEALDEVYKIKNNELKLENLLLLSKINQQKNNIPKAINYAKECFDYQPKLPVLIEIYQQLSDLSRMSNSLALALEYQDLAVLMKDSLAKITDMSRVANNQIRFDLINSEKELAENRAKQKSERKFFIFATTFVIILILILLWIFRIRSIKNKQYKIISELELDKGKNNKLLLEQQLKEQETLALLAQEQLNNEKLLLRQQLHEQEVLSSLEQERLNNEIDLRNRQLMSKILFQSERNELIKEIVDTLSSIPDYGENKILYSVIRQLKLQLKESSDWDSFLTYFEQINPSFVSCLKKHHPDLTINEIRLLSYMYLNLDTKEISKLLNITPNYCRKKKQRISKKINIPTSDIYDYIINLV